MDLDDTPEQAAYRGRVRDWLERHRDEAPVLSGEGALREESEIVAARRAWQAQLAAGGLAGVTWPPEYGGQGLGPVEQVICNQEIARAAVPGVLDMIGVGMLGPTIIAHGTEEQKNRCLGPMLHGQEIWCQLFSEPAAGSDLAGIQARAADDGRRLDGSRARRCGPRRAVRLLRTAARPHRPGRAQAQRPVDVHRRRWTPPESPCAACARSPARRSSTRSSSTRSRSPATRSWAAPAAAGRSRSRR